MKSYKTLEEWKSDFERIKQNRNDQHLFDHVVKCINNSSDKIKQEITDYLLNSSLESNPWIALAQIKNKSPGNTVFVKSKDDPWFLA